MQETFIPCTNYQEDTHRCWATKECDVCSCKGNLIKCDFYPDNKKAGLSMAISFEDQLKKSTEPCTHEWHHLSTHYDLWVDQTDLWRRADIFYCSKCCATKDVLREERSETRPIWWVGEEI